MSLANKQYGLVKPRKPGQSTLQRAKVFCDDSEPEEEGGDWVKKTLKRESEKSLQKKQTRLEIERALADDPTVYQYDEVYDKIEEKKAENKKLKSLDKKPKYIHSLLKQAERRKKEQERRYERDVQREREAEGEQFKDKEAFVTSAYRTKLEEFRKMDEEEKKMEHIEAIMDVSKQKDLSGFYRHLYRQTTGDGSATEPRDVKIKEEPPDSKSNTPGKDTGKKSDERRKNSAPKADKEHRSGPASRHYRKRRASSSDREEVKNGKRKAPATDGDRDSDDSSSSSESSSESSDSDEASENVVDKVGKDEKKTSGSETAVAGNIVEEAKDSTEEAKKDNEEKEGTQMPVAKINIWEKRTVGAVFEAALERYYARKASRLAG